LVVNPVGDMTMFNLKSKKAIVTGGGGGIGSAMGQALYNAGAQVLLVGRSESVDEAADNIGNREKPVQSLRADLSNDEKLESVFKQCVDCLGGLDIIAVCHGTLHIAEATDHGKEGWDKTIGVNLTSVFRLNQLAGRQMIQQGSGKIINIASMLSFSGGLMATSYAASKGGVAQLTKALANEWSGKGVNVNAIAPGYIQTKLNKHIWSDPVRNQQILDRLPSGRWGLPSDLMGATVFLSSAASDYVHGVILPVDGGWLAR
jgi:2-deoxy-D-gluconate 3-dehydrogenase